jgi:hypothetical protein
VAEEKQDGDVSSESSDEDSEEEYDSVDGMNDPAFEKPAPLKTESYLGREIESIKQKFYQPQAMLS